MEIYGFAAKVERDGKYYVGSVKELHAHTQATSLRELKKNLKEVVSLVLEDVLRHESEYNKSIVAEVKAKLIQKLLLLA